MWLPNNAIAFDGVQKFAYFIGFNQSTCNDTIFFPHSNCSVNELEIYPLVSIETYEVDFAHPYAVPLTTFGIRSFPSFQTGLLTRVANNWRPSASDPNGLGYSNVIVFENIINKAEPDMFLELNAMITNSAGEPVGQLTKEILLRWLGEFLTEMTKSNQMLVNDGRGFSFEIGNHLLTGASHGKLFRNPGTASVERIKPSESTDVVIASAGRELLSSSLRSNKSLDVTFSAKGKQFMCAAEPLLDQYGLAWMAVVALSLTDLFNDINKAALQMLGITAACIAVLSVRQLLKGV